MSAPTERARQSPAAPEPAPVPGASELPGIRRSRWLRLILCQTLQIPAVALVALSTHPSSWWVAGIWGSCCCCAGTDSQSPWRNRALVAQAVAWLLAAGLFGTSMPRPGGT